ncbi:chaplin [Kitasatospora sp. NPDC088391]|uniref:chaplin n=1 Tax=Kitasatospora sp. NPDC088391 TaxID=3364074 RepID=UPI00382671EC
MATGSVLASTAGYAHAAADAHGAATNSPGVGSGNAVQVPVNIPVNACGNTINVIGLLNPAYGNDCSNVSTGGRHGSTTGSGSTGSGSTGSGGTRSGSGGSGSTAGSGASGTTANSPGVLSGNQVQAPVSAPVNACGNSANVVGVGNPAFGNECGSAPAPHQPPATPPVTPPPGDDCQPPTPPPTDDCPETGGEHGGTPGTPTTPGTDRNGGQNGEQPTPPSTPTPVVQARAAMPAEAQLAHTGASALEVLAPAGALLMLGGGVLYRRSRSLARR